KDVRGMPVGVEKDRKRQAVLFGNGTDSLGRFASIGVEGEDQRPALVVFRQLVQVLLDMTAAGASGAPETQDDDSFSPPPGVLLQFAEPYGSPVQVAQCEIGHLGANDDLVRRCQVVLVRGTGRRASPIVSVVWRTGLRSGLGGAHCPG